MGSGIGSREGNLVDSVGRLFFTFEQLGEKIVVDGSFTSPQIWHQCLQTEEWGGEDKEFLKAF